MIADTMTIGMISDTMTTGMISGTIFAASGILSFLRKRQRLERCLPFSGSIASYV
jgi:hypothetical protein